MPSNKFAEYPHGPMYVINGRTDGRAGGRAGGRADGRTGGRAGGRAGGRMCERTGGQISKCLCMCVEL